MQLTAHFVSPIAAGRSSPTAHYQQRFPGPSLQRERLLPIAVATNLRIAESQHRPPPADPEPVPISHVDHSGRRSPPISVLNGTARFVSFCVVRPRPRRRVLLSVPDRNSAPVLGRSPLVALFGCVPGISGPFGRASRPEGGGSEVGTMTVMSSIRFSSARPSQGPTFTEIPHTQND